MQKDTPSRLRTSVEYHIGLIGIPTDTRRFIFTHFNFLLFTTIPGVFINTFFFRQDGRISTIAVYNSIVCFGTAMCMHLSSRISLKKSPAFVMRIGIAIYNVFYIVLLLLQHDAAHYTVLLGLLNAVASGFYWQGYNEMVKLCTEEGNLDRTVSLIGLANSVVTLVIPLFSGLVITYCPGMTGYTIIFVLSFISSLYTTYLSTKLENKKIHGVSNIPAVYRYIFTHRRVLAGDCAELLRGIRNSAFPIFLSIIFFKFVTNEALLGVNNMLCGVVSIVAYIAAGKVVRPGNRLKSLLYATLITVVIFLPLFFVMNAAAVFVLAIVNAFVCAFIDNPAFAVFYALFDEPAEGITFSQIMATHEVFFATGRVIGFVLLTVLSATSFMLASFVLIENVSLVGTWAILHFWGGLKEPCKTGELAAEK